MNILVINYVNQQSYGFQNFGRVPCVDEFVFIDDVQYKVLIVEHHNFDTTGFYGKVFVKKVTRIN